MDYITEKGNLLRLKLCNNTDLFSFMAGVKVVQPKVPQYYLEQRDIYIDNPNDPRYIDAIELYQVDIAIAATKGMLELAVVRDDELIKKERSKLKYRLIGATDSEVWITYLTNSLTTTDIFTIVNQTFLTENNVYDILSVLANSISRGGVSILDARLKNALNSQINVDSINLYGAQLVHPMDEYTACVESGISWLVWAELSSAKKAEVLSLYRVRSIVKTHSEDESAIEAEKRSKAN